MAAGIIGRKSTKSRSNDRVRPGKRPAPIRIVSATAAGSVLTVVFDQPVALKGVPQYGTGVAGADPVSAVLTTPTTVAITYDVAIAAAAELQVPFEDPAVRNASGGFVSPTGFVI